MTLGRKAASDDDDILQILCFPCFYHSFILHVVKINIIGQKYD